MLEIAILAAQTLNCTMMALWLVVALRDNLTAPRLNLDSVIEILRLDAMARDYPQHYETLRPRRIVDPGRARLLFRLIVAAEAMVALALAVACVALVGALAGLVAPDTARALALFACMGFGAIWAAFLIGGNHFVYWLCHGNAQRTHFDLLLWAVGSQILLILG